VVTLTTSTAGAEIWYRLGGGDSWTPYSAPLSLFKETTVSYYGKHGNKKTIIRHATYQFTDPPSKLDSDNDGVPDYVEIANGLDPARAADSDGDGYSDLEELLSNSSPTDAGSLPANSSHIELKSGFDLIQAPRPLDGIANTPTVSQTNTPVRAYDLPGSLLGSSTTTNLNLNGVLNPAALMSNIVVDVNQRLLAVATPQHFAVVTTNTNNVVIGRELIALVAVPAVEHNLGIPYSYAGGDLQLEASNWVAAAQAAQNNIARERVIGALDMYDTLAALLVEKKFSEILAGRGVTEATNLTLFPFRPTDVGRAALKRPQLQQIEELGTNNAPAFRLVEIQSAINNLVLPATPFSAPLRNLTAEIYRISSALHDAQPGKYPSPVDTLRDFLWTGVLQSNYLAQTPLTPSDLANASASAESILGAISARPTTNVTLLVRMDTFSSDCTMLDFPLGQGSASLWHRKGMPYRLIDTFNLPPGSELQVLGFTDTTNQSCGAFPIEVISISLDAVPAVSSLDADGDLLLDELEWLLFGGLDQDGNGDADGDGISNSQEMFGGAELTNGLTPASAQQDLWPQLQLSPAPGNRWKLRWNMPEAYANKVQFKLLTSSSIGAAWVETPLAPSHSDDGHFEALLPTSSAPSQFFKLSLSLK
jgi:hypothetical protein